MRRYLGLGCLLALLVIPTSAWAQGAIAARTLPADMACKSTIQSTVTASVQGIAGVTGQFIYICGIIVVIESGTTPAWSLIEGTGLVCATAPTAMIGGTTGTIASSIGSPFIATNRAPWLRTAIAGDSLCFIVSGTTPSIDVTVTYVQAP